MGRCVVATWITNKGEAMNKCMRTDLIGIFMGSYDESPLYTGVRIANIVFYGDRKVLRNDFVNASM